MLGGTQILPILGGGTQIMLIIREGCPYFTGEISKHPPTVIFSEWSLISAVLLCDSIQMNWAKLITENV